MNKTLNNKSHPGIKNPDVLNTEKPTLLLAGPEAPENAKQDKNEKQEVTFQTKCTFCK